MSSWSVRFVVGFGECWAHCFTIWVFGSIRVTTNSGSIPFVISTSCVKGLPLLPWFVSNVSKVRRVRIRFNCKPTWFQINLRTPNRAYVVPPPLLRQDCGAVTSSSARSPHNHYDNTHFIVIDGPVSPYMDLPLTLFCVTMVVPTVSSTVAP